uniref:Uncharacterized protein n=1 Tax=Anguilla anguilla TaxID=7936 RepID=A0A0E9U6D0_ANGAN
MQTSIDPFILQCLFTNINTHISLFFYSAN